MSAGITVLIWFWSDLCLWQAEKNLLLRKNQVASNWLDRSHWFRRNADPRICLAEIRTARRLQDFQKVETCLQQASQLGISYTEIQRERWLAMAQARQFKPIENHWIELLQDPREDEPEIARAYFHWAMSTHYLELLPKVLEMWHQDYPHDAEPLVLQGRYHQMLDEWPDAESAYRRAVELDPRDDDTQLLYAKALQAVAKIPQAISAFREYLVRHPKNLEANRELAKCLSNAGDLDQSLKILKRSLELAPDDLETQLLYGEMLLSAAEYASAAEVLEKVRRSVPEDTNVAYRLAGALKVLGRMSDAEALFAEVSAAKPELELKAKLEKELRNQPRNIDLRMKIAEITAKYVSRRDAIRWYLNILQFAPDYLPAHAALAELYRQLGDDKLAEFHSRAARQNPQLNSVTGAIPPGNSAK